MKLNGKRLLALLAVLCLVISQCSVVVAEEVYKCPNCGQTVFVTVYDNDKCVEPTCTEKGYGHRVCANCQTEYEPKPYINVNPLGHDYSGEPDVDEQVVKPATCKEKGLKTITTTLVCARDGCDEVLSEDVVNIELDMVPHTWAEEPEEVEGTRIGEKCVEPGSFEQAIFCTVCGAEKPDSRETVEVPSAGHKPAEEYVVDEKSRVPSTCIKAGKHDEVLYCTVCHIELDRKTVNDELAAHVADKPVVENLQPQTCVDYAKYDLVTYCKVCGLEMAREPIDEKELDPDDRRYGNDPERPGLNLHVWELDLDNPNNVEPTCFAEGLGNYYCTNCGAKNEGVKLEKTPHNYGEPVSVPATCSEKGGLIAECQNDGCTEEVEGHFNYLKVYEIVPDNHKWELAPVKPDANPEEIGVSASRAATCTKYGVNAYVCAYNKTHRYAEQIAPLGHDEEVIPAIKPTCTEVGYTAGVVCMRAGCDGTAEDLPDGYPQDNLPENYVKVIKAPSVIPAKGHVVLDYLVDDDEYDPATCTEDGTIVYKCAVCGERVVKEQKATGHDWFRVEDDDNPADCINGGYASFRCANCGEEKREEIPATGEHQFGEWIEEPATCKTAGRIYRVCDVCGYEDVQEFLDVNPEAHDWEIDWDDVKKYPSCTEAGIGAMVCNICGATKYGRIEPTGHNPIEIPAVEPTCTENGMTAGSICEWCGETLEESEVIEALGHDWEEVSVEGATCVKPGKATYVCTRCGEEDTEEGILGDHTLIRWKALDKAPSCVSAAAEAYVCYYCDYVEYRENGKADPSAHVWVKLEQISVPTCVSGALDLYACYFCDARIIKESETSKADPSNHVWCDVGDKMACYYCDATKAK
jgi:hypothetical protein